MSRVMQFQKALDRADSKESMMEQLSDSERKFKQACVQLTLLNKQLDDCKERYTRAKNDNFRRFRYNLRLKLAVMEGVRNMYYDYAYMKAEHVARLRHDLFGEVVEIVNSGADTDIDVVYGQGRDDYVCRTLLSLDCATKPTDPICGTDRKNYTNDCELAKAHCRHTYVHQLHTGACVTVDDVRTTMTTEELINGYIIVANVMCSYLSYIDCGVITHSADEKVCCTNGITYPNFCEYEKYRCNHSHVGVAHIGQCTHA